MLPRIPQFLLSIFRFVALSVIGILLLEPLLNSLSKVKFPPIVAVLQDASESIAIQKKAEFAKSQYPDLLKGFLKDFGNEYTVDAYRFGNELQLGLEPDSLAFAQSGTNISNALKETQKLYQNQNLGAIVVVSDGINTTGLNPLYAIEGIKQPVYTVLLGDTTEQKDIAIKEALYNDIAYLNNESPIKVKIRNVGYDNADLKVTLKGQGKVIGTENLVLSNNKPQGEVNFLIKPNRVGLQQFQVVVSRMDDEITYRNNSKTLYINVLETRVKIALFGGAPHPDLGAIQNALVRDKSYELKQFVLKGSGTYYTDPNSYNFSDFDLFILHNFPNSNADKAVVNKIVKEIKNRKAPVMYFCGKFADLKTMQPLFEYMSITPKSMNPKSDEVIVNFLKKYKNHSTFTFSDTWLDWINNSPPVFRNKSNWEAKTTAEVYATAKIKNIDLDYPVFALQSQLGRKNTVFLGENFWRMRAFSFTETESFDAFDDWLFNNIKWLMVSDDKRKFKVYPSKKLFTGSDPVTFKGQVYDDSYNPVSNVSVKLTMTAPDGKENIYYLSEVNQGQYFLELFSLAEGTYSYKAEGKKDEIVLGKDRGQFSIGKSSIEHFRLQADKDMMEQLALRTGGEFIYAQNMADLSEKVKALPNLKPVVDFKRSRRPVLNLGWILAILLSMLSIEWIVRKVYSLL